MNELSNGHTVPTVETLEKMAQVLEAPMYKLLYDGEAPPKLENLPNRKTADEIYRQRTNGKRCAPPLICPTGQPIPCERSE